MWMERSSVKYTKFTTIVNHHDTELMTWENLDNCYLNQSVRDKVVCKFDATYVLQHYFSKETVTKYREALMKIANAEEVALDAKTFSDAITTWLEEDEVFRNNIRTIYYSCPDNSSFGWHIINTFADAIKSVEAKYRSFFRGRPEVVICISNGYLYFSIPDIDYKPVLPDKVECEVLSYAKNWRGEFEYSEQQ